jgi:glycosyltransferase involved in cell wall biosynthesis
VSETSARPLVRHIIPQLSPGGAARAMVGLAKYSARGGGYRHEVISLGRADRRALALAAAAGIPVISVAEPARAAAIAADADILQLHFWNAPELHALLAGGFSAVRVIAWCHVNGAAPPHLIPSRLFEVADVVVAAAADTLELALFRAAGAERVALIGGGADFERIAQVPRHPHAAFTVGHVGTLDFAKLHPEFIAMSAAVPGARFVVCGEGAAVPELRRQAEAAGAADRFEFRGYVEDLAAVLGEFDAFGYPLCEGNSTTTELVLQEAMHAGVVPVVLPFGGAAGLVVDGESGLVAPSVADYTAALRRLKSDPDERARLGRNAADRARTLYGADNCARQFDALYARLMGKPKRPRPAARAGALSARFPGAQLLVQSLADAADDFRQSGEGDDETTLFEADRRVAASGIGIGNTVLQYRSCFPGDGLLALWSGLVLWRRGRPALALAEFSRAVRSDCPHWRAAYYLACLARELGSLEIVAQASAILREAAPHRVAEFA